MYKITNLNSNDYEILDVINYVKIQNNGTIVICDESSAQGILSKDRSKIMALKDKGMENDYELVQIDKINLDQYLEEYLNPLVKKNKQLEYESELYKECLLEICDIIYA